MDDTGVLWPDDPVERLSVRRSIPTWIAERWIGERGEPEADALAEALNHPGPICIRPNRRLNDRATLERRLVAEGMSVEPGVAAPHALRLRGRPDIRGSKAFRDGRFEVQDEGSQLIAEAVRAQPGERIVDLCAGAGGKTLALLDDTQDEGTLWAVEPDPQRVHDLQNRLGRVSCRSVRVLAGPAEAVSLPRDVDRVLVDAPCSALGTWRRGPHRRWTYQPADVRRFAKVQTELLRVARTILRPGGRLVYATCTLLQEENQQVAQALGITPCEERELLPHRLDTDGFYLAAFRMDDLDRVT